MVRRGQSAAGQQAPHLHWQGHGRRLPAVPRIRRTLLERVVPVRPVQLRVDGAAADVAPPNRLWLGDNLLAMQHLRRTGEPFRLVYADPPFATEGRYTTQAGEAAYDDRWPGGLHAYLDMLYPRLRLMHDLLMPGGSLFLHLDQRAVHYARVLLDEMFGAAGFRNEIVWQRGPNRGRKAAARQLGRVTDHILWYTRGGRWRFHPSMVEHHLALRADGRLPKGLRRDAAGRVFKTAPRGDYTDASIAALERQGRIHRTSGGQVRVKYFLEERDGGLVDRQAAGNLWTDLPDKMHLPLEERLDFPTQKPEALLARILEIASDPGDVVADFFCGSGTTLAVAERLGRRWCGADLSETAVRLTTARLRRLAQRPFLVERMEAESESRSSRKR